MAAGSHSVGETTARMAYLTVVSGALALPGVVLADVALERAGLTGRHVVRLGQADVDLAIVVAKVAVGTLAAIIVLGAMRD